ncbi:MAG: hypothetical protein AB7Y46_16370 [Armatimonadota bacterium]
MTGEELVQKVREASAHRQRVIEAVCGACENKCCKQMTMMGGQDLRRLLREMLMSSEFEQRVRGGLRRVADRLEADLRAVQQVTELLSAAHGTGASADLAALRANVEDWAAFVAWLRSDYDLRLEELRRLLVFSAIRSNTLNALGRFRGGLGALVNLSGREGTFRFHGRRIAPPPCLFYLDDIGCICEEAKPAKCANFFCAGVPNLLAELRRTLSFDEFVLANFTATSLARVIATLRLERKLGQEFIDPMIVVGVSDADVEAIAGAMGRAGESVRLKRVDRPGMRSAAEVEQELAAIPERTGLVEVYPAIDGNTLYELALALDRIRLRDEHPSFVLLARELVATPVAHPLWDDQMMAQPLGALDLFVLEPQ